MMITPPHLSDVASTTSKRGHFWIPGERLESRYGTVQSAPMFVAWEAPENIIQPYPLVLVHGGGGQGTDWTGTIDGRPGWASGFLAAGFAVYIVDRPGHGRSPYHPDVVGPMSEPFPYEAAKALFLPEESSTHQTQWGYSREIGSHDMDQLLSSMGPLPKSLVDSQVMDADRLARLLDIVGPTVLVSHSAGSPVSWLAADARPELVKGIAAVEPMGPPFAQLPGIGSLDWGLTAAPITFDPPITSIDALRRANTEQLRIPALVGLPVGVITGGVSPFASFTSEIIDFLSCVGADAEWIHLPEYGIEGNGHGLIFESNSNETIRPVIDWAVRI